jgi:hypothetical protein
VISSAIVATIDRQRWQCHGGKATIGAMSATVQHGRRLRRLAWGLAALTVALEVGETVLALTSSDVADPAANDVIPSVLGVAFATVGAFIATRESRNPLGWIFLGVGLSVGVGGWSHDFVEVRLADGRGHDWIVGAAAAYSDTSWVPFILVPATFLLLLFPDGRLPSRRWRHVARCAAAGIAATFVTGIGAQPLEDFPTIDNPLAIDRSVQDPMTGLGFLLILIGMVGAVASIVTRYRRAGALQRQQIKWLAASGALVVITFPTMLVLYDTLPFGVPDTAIMLSVLGLPIATGVAILRHDLYDIDVVINRTLVYGALTGLLAGAYLGSVLLLQLVLSPSSDFAIAGSTLAVAALFRPARTRVQSLVDRRFYRRKYDAQRTLQVFAARLRDEVSLDALSTELRAVVAETMQPAHVSVWLRGPRT